jgi:hypothetical protein
VLLHTVKIDGARQISNVKIPFAEPRNNTYAMVVSFSYI